MTPCKRVEIVIEEALVPRVRELLISLGATAFTLLPQARGQGDRGRRRGDDPTGTLTNAVIIVACDEVELAERIANAMQPLLTQSGGMCLISDAQWVDH